MIDAKDKLPDLTDNYGSSPSGKDETKNKIKKIITRIIGIGILILVGIGIAVGSAVGLSYALLRYISIGGLSALFISSPFIFTGTIIFFLLLTVAMICFCLCMSCIFYKREQQKTQLIILSETPPLVNAKDEDW